MFYFIYSSQNLYFIYNYNKDDKKKREHVTIRCLIRKINVEYNLVIENKCINKVSY